MVFLPRALSVERRVLNELMVDRSSDLKIGAAPDHGNGGYFLGIIDDVRLYNKGFGSEDVYHLYRGDPAVVDYEEPRLGSRFGMNGTITKVNSPSLPSVTVPALVYGNKINGLDLGESPNLSYTLSGLPPGLTNDSAFSPEIIPGLFAWYSADNESFVMHEQRIYERNDSVAVDNLCYNSSMRQMDPPPMIFREMEIMADS